MAVVVPRQNTPLTKEQALAALQRAWGAPLSRNLASSLLSLVWVETGAGKQAQNFNPGNISASDNYGGKLWRPPWYPEPGPDTTQRNRDLHAAMLAKKAPSGFRAYDTLEQGFADFVAQLRHSFPEVIAAADGSADDFRKALAQKYSHDYNNPQATATFAKLREQFAPLVAHLPSTTVHSVAAKTIGIVALVGGSAWLFRDAIKRLFA